MNTRTSSIILKYRDKDATEVISDDLEEFTWTDVASGEADTFSIVLNDMNLKWLKGFFPHGSDYIKTWIKVSDWQYQKDTRKKYCGKFQVDSFTASGFAQTFQIDAISIPIRTSFNVTQRNRTFKKTSVKSIMKKIASNAKCNLVYQAKNYNIDNISQSGQTDMAFGFSLCEQYGLCMKVYNGKIIVYDQTRYEKRKAIYTIDRSQLAESGSYSFNRQITNLYHGVKMQYTNKSGKTVTYKYKVPGKSDSRYLFISGSADSHADAEVKAKAQLLKNLRSAQSITLKLMGDPKYLAATTFQLTGFGKINGKYFIDQVTHQKSGKYTTTIVAHPVVTNVK